MWRGRGGNDKGRRNKNVDRKVKEKEEKDREEQGWKKRIQNGKEGINKGKQIIANVENRTQQTALWKTQTECFSRDCNRCGVVQIDRRRQCLLTSEAARCCQTLVTASGTTRRHISESNSHQSRRLVNLKFSLQVAKIHRNVDVKLLSVWKLRLVWCYADKSKLQEQWAPFLPPPRWVLPSVNRDKVQPHNALRFASLPEWKSPW